MKVWHEKLRKLLITKNYSQPVHIFKQLVKKYQLKMEKIIENHKTSAFSLFTPN